VAVVLRQDQGIDQIVAFIVREDNHAENTVASMATQSDAEFGAGLRGILSALLPPYMVPSRFEFMNEVPRLTSGKIDRNELKRCVLQAVVASGESDVAESATEEVLFSALASLFPDRRYGAMLIFSMILAAIR
jgi:acyl-coenzyme A synthetase/AMP-(fatty) acid ligase